MSEKFSYSKLDTFVQCGFKYKLRYVDRHFLYTDSIATEVGTAIHRAEEAVANALMKNEPIDYTTIKNTLIISIMKIRNKYPEAFLEKDKSNRTYEEKLNTYLTEGIYRLEKQIKYHTGYQVIAAEQAFEFEFNGALFTGSIDRIIYDKNLDKWIIQDVKTYAIPVDYEKIKHLPLQFTVYVLALAKLYNITDFTKISCQYDLPFCDTIQTAGLECGFGDLSLDYLRAQLNEIADNDFCPRPSPLCAWCEFSPTNPQQPEEGKNLCPYHSLWTKDNKTKKVASAWTGLKEYPIILEQYITKQKGESNG